MTIILFLDGEFHDVIELSEDVLKQMEEKDILYEFAKAGFTFHHPDSRAVKINSVEELFDYVNE
jgi:hypothetical protein